MDSEMATDSGRTTATSTDRGGVTVSPVRRFQRLAARASSTETSSAAAASAVLVEVAGGGGGGATASEPAPAAAVSFAGWLAQLGVWRVPATTRVDGGDSAGGSGTVAIQPRRLDAPAGAPAGAAGRQLPLLASPATSAPAPTMASTRNNASSTHISGGSQHQNQRPLSDSLSPETPETPAAVETTASSTTLVSSLSSSHLGHTMPSVSNSALVSDAITASGKSPTLSDALTSTHVSGATLSLRGGGDAKSSNTNGVHRRAGNSLKPSTTSTTSSAFHMTEDDLNVKILRERVIEDDGEGTRSSMVSGERDVYRRTKRVTMATSTEFGGATSGDAAAAMAPKASLTVSTTSVSVTRSRKKTRKLTTTTDGDADVSDAHDTEDGGCVADIGDLDSENSIIYDHFHPHRGQGVDHSRVLAKLADYDDFETDPTSCINRYCVGVRHMPTWYIDNLFITRGYRRITNSYRGCLLSLFYVHNETGNVYTHLIGVILFIVFALAFVFGGASIRVSTNTWGDNLAFGAIYLGSIACLGLSTTFHLCCCHSSNVLVLWNKADYVGIVTLIVGSFIPAIYYGFYCYPTMQMVYTVCITTLGATTMFITLMRRFASPQYRYFRTSLFVGLGISGIVPLIHVIIHYGLDLSVRIFAAYHVVTMGAMYLIGVVIYAYRLPERWIHGVFDIWGHSHQIWHLLVLSGALIHYMGVVEMYRWRHDVDPVCALSIDQLRLHV